NENRLMEAKGFGFKTQEEIRKAIEFSNANQGFFLYAKVEKIAATLLGLLVSYFPEKQHMLTGEMRRKCEIITSVDILTTASITAIGAFLEEHPIYIDTAALDNAVEFSDELGIRYRIQSTSEDLFARDLLLTTGS